MQGRFGRSAIDVFALAAREAHNLGCQFIGSELILLALIKLDGRCTEIFRRLDLDFDKTCAFIKATVLTNSIPERDLDGKEFSSDAKNILRAARSETLLFSRDIMLEEHLLLGILREPETVAGALMKQLKIDLELLRKETQRSAINNTEIGEAGPDFTSTSSLSSAPAPVLKNIQPASPLAAAISKPASLKRPKPPGAVRLETDAFSSDTVQLLANTQWLAVQMGAPSVELEHLFYAALTQDTFVKYELVACGAGNKELEAFKSGVIGKSLPKKVPEAAEVLRKTIGHSMEVATFWQSYQVEPEHLFLSMSDLKITPSVLELFPQFNMAAFLRTITQTLQEKRDKLGSRAQVQEHVRLNSKLPNYLDTCIDQVPDKTLAQTLAQTPEQETKPTYDHSPGKEGFSASCCEALRAASLEAENLGQVEICPEILLLGLISLTGELPQQILARYGIDFAAVKSRCKAMFSWAPTGASEKECLSPRHNEMVTLILNSAYLKAHGNSAEVTPADVLQYMLTLGEGHVNSLFSDLAVTSADLLQALSSATTARTKADEAEVYLESLPFSKPVSVNSATSIKSKNLSEDLLFEQLDRISLDILRRACETAACNKQELIASEHLLIALLSVPSPAKALLRSLGLNEKLIEKQLAKLIAISPQPDAKKIVLMPSGGAFPLLDESDLIPVLPQSARVLNSDCLHTFNLAAAFATIDSSYITSLDLLMGMLVSRAGLGFQVLTALKHDPAELYQNCYKLKNSA